MEILIIAVLLLLLCIVVGTLLWMHIPKRFSKSEKPLTFYDEGKTPRFFITGDKHRGFQSVKQFCEQLPTHKQDVLIILGDCGFNYYGDTRDDKLKQELAELNITLFCLHGNKENRPENVGTYGIQSFCGGYVYYEPKYPSLLFAIDGEIYTFEGRKYLAVGGAHSVDRLRCLEEGLPFWDDEMPSEETKKKVEAALQRENNTLYGMLTHTCPIQYLPTEMFMTTRQNNELKKKPSKRKHKIFKPDIDRATEQWLCELELGLHYQIWFCGHYHTDKTIDKLHMLYRKIRPLHFESEVNGKDAI